MFFIFINRSIIYTTFIRVNTLKKIIKNKACCRKCRDIIESKHTHDFGTCKCRARSIEGGLEYQKFTGSKENIDTSYSVYE